MKKIVSFFAAALLGISVIISIPVFASAETKNSQYSYTIQDLQNLQDFLIARPTEENLVGKPYDLNSDGVWNVFDLCLMKRAILNQQKDTSDILVAYFSQTGNILFHYRRDYETIDINCSDYANSDRMRNK